MRRTAVMAWFLSIGVLLAPGCDHGASSESTQPAHSELHERGTSPGQDAAARPQQPTADVATPARGEAMGWVPRDALAVLRIPSLDIRRSFEATAIHEALKSLELGPLMTRIDAILEGLRYQMLSKSPMADHVWKVLEKLEGELVFGIVDVSPQSFMASTQGDMPLSAVAHVRIGTQEPRVLELMQAAVMTPGIRGILRMTSPGHFSILHPRARFEVVVQQGWLSAYVGPSRGAANALARFRDLKPSQSFLATEVVRGAPEAARSQDAYVEGFLNLDPVWALVDELAPPRAKAIMGAMRIRGLRGISLVSSIHEGRFHDQLTLHAPAHDDLLSLMLRQPPIDRAYARFVFADADCASFNAFDLKSTWRAVESRVPPRQRRLMAEGAREMKQETGLDLEQDILANFGPQVVLSMKGDPAAAILTEREFEASLAVQVGNVARAKQILSGFFEEAGLGPSLSGRRVGDFVCTTLALRLPGAPEWLELCYGFVGDALVISTSPRVFEKTVAAWGEDGRALPKAIRSALGTMVPGTWSCTARSSLTQLKSLYGLADIILDKVSDVTGRAADGPASLEELGAPPWAVMEKAFAGLSPSVTSLVKVPAGFRLESRTAIPNLLVGGAPVAIVASIAIPSLLAARTRANEYAAIATLRNLVSAQAQFQAMASADRDKDGAGEFAYFGELSGATPLPDGKRLNPPLLSTTFRNVHDGIVERSGYMFRIILLNPLGQPIYETPGGGAPEGVRADAAERRFIAYAWPREHGTTGTRAYLVDESGIIFFSPNDDASITLSGRSHQPVPGKSFPLLRPGRRPTGPMMMEGRDGTFWMQIR